MIIISPSNCVWFVNVNHVSVCLSLELRLTVRYQAVVAYLPPDLATVYRHIKIYFC